MIVIPCGTRKYRFNWVTVKRFGDEVELCLHKVQRTPGLECDEDVRLCAEKGTVNEEKLANNISRAVSVIRELGRCNPWTFFFTGTFSKDKIDRTCLETIKKSVSQWLRNYNTKHNTNIKYLLVPELHKDRKGWHFHGLLYGLPISHLRQFTFEEKLPHKLRNRMRQGYTEYDWPAWAKKFGHCNIEQIRSRERSISYLTKYITKHIDMGVTELGKHMYLASQGLNHAITLKEGWLTGLYSADKLFSDGFENEYVKKVSFKLTDETAKSALADFIANIKCESELWSG